MPHFRLNYRNTVAKIEGMERNLFNRIDRIERNLFLIRIL